MPNKPIPRWFLLFAIVTLAASLVLAGITATLRMKSVTLAAVTALLQTLFVVALFVERSLEVFIVAWRGPDEKARESDVRSAQRDLGALTLAGALGTPDYLTANSALAQAVKARDIYEAETRRIRLVAGLVVGVLIAVAGIRSFEMFVQLREKNITLLEHVSGVLFNTLNVLVTGGLIGGGSDVINKVLKVITEFLDKTVARLRGDIY